MTNQSLTVINAYPAPVTNIYELFNLNFVEDVVLDIEATVQFNANLIWSQSDIKPVTNRRWRLMARC